METKFDDSVADDSVADDSVADDSVADDSVFIDLRKGPDVQSDKRLPRGAIAYDYNGSKTGSKTGFNSTVFWTSPIEIPIPTRRRPLYDTLARKYNDFVTKHPLFDITALPSNLWAATKWTASTVSDVTSATFKLIGAATRATIKFARDNWGVTSAVILAVVAAVVTTAALIFFFPGAIAAIAAFSVSLPLFGTVAPFAVLGAMHIFAASAAVGVIFAAPAALAFSALINAGAWVYGKIDKLVTPAQTQYKNAYNEASQLFVTKMAGLNQEERRIETDKEAERVSKLGIETTIDAHLSEGEASHASQPVTILDSAAAQKAVHYGDKHLPTPNRYALLGQPRVVPPVDPTLDSSGLGYGI